MFFDPPNFTFPFGCHICEVEVEPDTGQVELTRYVAVDDCGNVDQPDDRRRPGARRRRPGIGQALYEGAIYDEDGQLLTCTLVDYLMPRRPRVPAVELDRTETPSPDQPAGRQGHRRGGHDRGHRRRS